MLCFLSLPVDDDDLVRIWSEHVCVAILGVCPVPLPTYLPYQPTLPTYLTYLTEHAVLRTPHHEPLAPPRPLIWAMAIRLVLVSEMVTIAWPLIHRGGSLAPP